MSTPKTVLPLLAAIALMALLWLAFHDGSVDPARAVVLPRTSAPGPATR